jgi:hypothetical protein
MEGMKKKRSAWHGLERDIANWLKKEFSSELRFKNSYQAIEGFPPYGFRSDGMLTDGETLLALEVEAGQTHPDTNVGKYWLLHQMHRQYKKIILFHIYTPAFDSYGWRKNLAEFYVDKLKDEVPLEYNLKDFRESNNYKDVLKEIKMEIKNKIDSEFSLKRRQLCQ